MKKNLTSIVLLLSGCWLAAQNSVTVSTAGELIQSIGSDRTIIIKAGLYKLSANDGTKGKYTAFTDVSDGKQFEISNVKNMKLKAEGKVTLLATPRYAWVILFNQCSGIYLEGITFGHTEAGYCSGGVLGFNNCTEFTIKNCELFGSGTEGVSLSGSSGFSFTGCVIRNCTYDIMSVQNSENVTFSGCTFKETGEFDLVMLMNSRKVTFKKCLFRDNFSNGYMPHLFFINEGCGDIYLEKCTFKNNKSSVFVNDGSRLKQKFNRFSENAF